MSQMFMSDVYGALWMIGEDFMAEVLWYYGRGIGEHFVL